MIESFKTHFEVLSKYFAAYLVNGMSVFRNWALILIAVANSATQLAVLRQPAAGPPHDAPVS